MRLPIQLRVQHKLTVKSEASKPTPAATSSAPSRAPGGRKPPAKKVLAQSTILQPVDDAADPLGPLGVPEPGPAPGPVLAEQAPTPPRKEPGARQVSGGRPAPAPAGDDADALSIRSRGPPPVQASAAGSVRQTQPSMSVEQAAKPSFDILVGDPHKVGDLTSSHIVYQVRTKVSKAQPATT